MEKLLKWLRGNFVAYLVACPMCLKVVYVAQMAVISDPFNCKSGHGCLLPAKRTKA